MTFPPYKKSPYPLCWIRAFPCYLRLTKHPDIPEFLVTQFQQFINGKRFELLQVFQEGCLQVICREAIVMVRAAQGFGDQFVYQVEALEFFGADAHGLGCLGSVFVVSPQDGRGGLWHSYRVDAVFEHQDAVGYADG